VKFFKKIFFTLTGVVIGFLALSQKPELKMHRTQVSVKDSSGWYFARSTQGHFSVLLPMPFNDYTVIAKDSLKNDIKSYAVGCQNKDGVTFMAVETILSSKKDIDMMKLVRGLNAVVIREEKRKGYESVFCKSVTNGRYAYLKYIKTNGCFMVLGAESLAGSQKTLDKLQEKFFSSLKFY
jgi:hypothetical protein